MFNRIRRPPAAVDTLPTGFGGRAGALIVVLACTPLPGAPGDAEQPLLIDADSGTYHDDPNGVLELSGNVRIRQGTWRVEAERVTATKREGKLHRVVATGGNNAPVRFRQRLAGEPPVHGHARTIDYSIAEQQTELTGDAFLSTGESEYTGGTILWNRKEKGVVCRNGCRYARLGPSSPD